MRSWESLWGTVLQQDCLVCLGNLLVESCCLVCPILESILLDWIPNITALHSFLANLKNPHNNRRTDPIRLLPCANPRFFEIWLDVYQPVEEEYQDKPKPLAIVAAIHYQESNLMERNFESLPPKGTILPGLMFFPWLVCIEMHRDHNNRPVVPESIDLHMQKNILSNKSVFNNYI